MSIQIKEPESGKILSIDLKKIESTPYPAWLLRIPDGGKTLIYRFKNQWRIKPDTLSKSLVQAIAAELKY